MKLCGFADLRNSESIYKNWQFCHLLMLLVEATAHQLVALFGGWDLSHLTVTV